MLTFEEVEEPVASWLSRSAELVDYYLSLPDLTCCRVLGGYVVYASDIPVMSLTDEVRMSETWLPATRFLLEGNTSAQVWAWEESNLTLTRIGEDVEMRDIQYSGAVVCPPTLFRLRDFASAIADASRPMVALIQEVHKVIDSRIASNFGTPESQKRLVFLKEEFSERWIKRLKKLDDELKKGGD